MSRTATIPPAQSSVSNLVYVQIGMSMIAHLFNPNTNMTLCKRSARNRSIVTGEFVRTCAVCSRRVAELKAHDETMRASAARMTEASGVEHTWDAHEGRIVKIEATPDGAPEFELYACTFHGISPGVHCCTQAQRLGAYLATERVRCAHCEEPIKDERKGCAVGHPLGSVEPNGAVCDWCIKHDHPRDIECTISCPTMAKCADCDEPAVAISATDGGAGADNSAKPRCKRHAIPQRQFCRVCQRFEVPAATVKTETGTFHFCPVHEADAAAYQPVTAPMPTKTMADYRPGTAVRRQLSELSHLNDRRTSSLALATIAAGVLAECVHGHRYAIFRCVLTGVRAEVEHQGITATDAQLRDWIAAQR